jgi:hypothetical protein
LEKVEEARHAIDVLARTISRYIPERIESKHERLLPADARTQSWEAAGSSVGMTEAATLHACNLVADIFC